MPGVPIAGDVWVWTGERLLSGSLQGAVAIAVVWVVCRRITALPAWARASLWWLASLKLIVALLPLPAIAMPILPGPPAPAVSRAATLAPAPAVVDAHTAAKPIAGIAVPVRIVPVWLMAVIALWLGGVAVHAFRLAVSYVKLRRVVGRAGPLAPEDAAASARIAAVLGLTRAPDIRVSPEIVRPLVAGAVRPTVLLPAREVAALSPEEREMVVCHELAHVKRRDLVFAWIPAIAERVFFFHPLARFAAREYVAEREAACDAFVLRTLDVAPRQYAEMLVRLGVGGFRPVFTASGASPSMSSLRRRLVMLNDLNSSRARRGVIALVVVAGGLTITPLRLTAKTSPVQPVAAPVQPIASPSASRPLAFQEAAQPQVPKSAQPSKPQPSAPAAPGTPPRKPPQSVEEQIREAVAEQRAALLDVEREFEKLRAEFAAALAKQQAKIVEAQVEALRFSGIEEQFARALQEVAYEKTGQDTTQQFLESQLRQLMAEQERMTAASRRISEQVEGIKRQLELAARPK